MEPVWEEISNTKGGRCHGKKEGSRDTLAKRRSELVVTEKFPECRSWWGVTDQKGQGVKRSCV